MDGFTYHNIFATKGIEYLVIIGFLIILIPFWIIINKRVEIARGIRKAMGVLTMDVLKVHRGIYYSRNHTWAFLEKSGSAKVGLDDLLLHLTGTVEMHRLKNPDDIVAKGEVFLEVEQQGKRLKISSPVSGKVMGINPLLYEEPGVLNEDPYDRGWIYRIRPDNWVEETRSCYLADDAVEWAGKELAKFKEFIIVSQVKHSPEPAMVILQDGGELSDHPLSGMPGEIWQDFQQEFLDQPV